MGPVPGAVAAGGNSNATFDLSSAPLGGMMASSTRTGPSANIFALSAQEMLTAHSNAPLTTMTATTTNNSNNTFLGSHGNALLPRTNNAQNKTAPSPFSNYNPRQRDLLQSVMTKEEDNELTNFFGTFAETLPPPQENDDDDDDDGEPDPLPDASMNM